MTQDFIFAQDVILDPDTGKSVAVVRNGGVFRDGTKIAVLVGAHMYDLNGNLLGRLATGAGSLPNSFKNLVEGKSADAERALVDSYAPRDNGAPQGRLTGHKPADCAVTISKMDGVESSRTITDVSPRVPDGNYTSTVAGESSTSRWSRDKNGWATESRPGRAAR
jgi:hypothetical protein